MVSQITRWMMVGVIFRGLMTSIDFFGEKYHSLFSCRTMKDKIEVFGRNSIGVLLLEGSERTFE